MRGSRLLLCLATVGLAGCQSTSVTDPTPSAIKPNPATIEIEVCPLSGKTVTSGKLPRWFSIYFGVLAHSNGKVYIGTNYHVARLVEFDPRTKTCKVVAAMSSRALHGGGPKLDTPTLRGDLGDGQFPMNRWVHAQDKIHAQLHEGRDGRVYGATHVKVEQADSTRTYPGGHWFAYDPRTGKTEDLGWARRHEGIITCCMDRERNVLYGVTWPTGYLIECRPGESDYRKRLHLLGTACTQLDCSPRYFDVVRDGRVYVPDGATGEVRVYDPKRRWMHRVPGLLTPPGPDGGLPAHAGALRATGRWRNWWMNGTKSPDGMHLFFVGQRSGHLTEIDATQGKWGVVIDHGRTVPWGKPDWSGPWPRMMCFGPGGLLFYAIGEQLLTYDPKSGVIADWGRTVSKSVPGRSIKLGCGGALGKDGRIYCAVGRGVGILDPRPIEARWRRMYSFKEGNAPRFVRRSPRRVIRPISERTTAVTKTGTE